MSLFPSHDKFTHKKGGGSHLVFSVQETWLLVVCFNIHMVTLSHSLWLLVDLECPCTLLVALVLTGLLYFRCQGWETACMPVSRKGSVYDG